MVCLLLAAVPTVPAYAATTGWVTSEGGRLRLAAAEPQPDGTVKAALLIDLKPGWTTYWRNPGESGIPPQFETEGSTNVASAKLAFPAPVAMKEAGLTVIGYDRSVALPLTIRRKAPDAAARLKAKVFIGVCRDICIPVRTTLTLDLPPATKQSTADVDAAKVRLAYAALPGPETPEFRIVSVKAADGGRSLDVAVRLPGTGIAGHASLFAAGPGSWTLGVAKRTATSASTVRFSVPVTSAPEGGSVAGVPIRLVVSDGERAIAVTKAVE